MGDYTPWLRDQYSDEGTRFGDYMNKKEVRAAMHIPDKVQAYSGCTADPDWEYHLQIEGSSWIYQYLKLAAPELRILHYSGDTDGAVPTYGTERWIADFKWEETKPWTPWLRDRQIVGYEKSYGNFDFVTVHGVGHMAPQWKREEVTALLNGWIHGEAY